MAFASIFVPDFILQAVVRAEPALRGRALALVEGTPPLCRVVACNAEAARAGVAPGMNKTDAAEFAGLEICPRSRAQEQSAHAALLDIGWSVSPHLEDAADDTIVLDLAGLSHLFPSDEAIGAQIVQRSCTCGLLPNVAIAANIETACIAARGFSGIAVIPPGEEPQRLADLPVSVLSPSLETVEVLNLWGVHTCAALAALPVLPLSERLGQEGIRLHALARVAGSRALVLAEPAHFFAEEMELDDAVEELEPLSFLLGRLLDQLCARLAARALAASVLRVRFEQQPSPGKARDLRDEAFPRGNPAGIYEKDLQLPVPARDSKMLLKLLRLRLQANPPGAPICKIALAAEAARPRATQGGLFRPRYPDPEKLEITIARLAGVVGEKNVGSPAPVDTHRPGEFEMQRFLAAAEAVKAAEAAAANHRNIASLDACNPRRGSVVPASFRSFRPPIPAALELDAGRPARIFFQGCCGNVQAASGPWRTSGDWWREDPWQHEEWDLEIHFCSSAEGERRDARANSQPGSGLYCVYYDALQRRWFVRGIYD